MRYRFKGIIRDTGRVVEGHVEAPTEAIAYNVMADNGIVSESMREDPRPGDFTRDQLNTQRDDVSNAVDSALDTASKEVDFDALTNRYKGKKVWVLDRSKIRDRVKSVVLASIKASQSEGTSQKDTLAKVNDALDKMFADKTNVSSPAGTGSIAIEEQIARLSAVVRRVESAVAQISVMARSGGGGGGGGRLSYDGLPGQNKRHDKVLLEIFESNLELQRTLDQLDPPKTAPSAPAAAAAPAGETGPATLAANAVPAAPSGSQDTGEGPALFVNGANQGDAAGSKQETS